MKGQQPYLNDLLERINMIESFTVGGRESFMNSLEVIGEIVKRLSPELLAPYPHIPWRQIAGFRDFLIHNYDKIDLEVVWKAIENDLPQLKHAAQTMLHRLISSDE